MKPATASFSFGALLSLASVCAAEGQEPLGQHIDPTKYRAACPDYKNYAMRQQYVHSLRQAHFIANRFCQFTVQRRANGAPIPKALEVLPNI